MRRRRLLAALGGSASLGLGGLLAYRANRTRTLSIASVETYDAAIRLDHREHPDSKFDHDVRPVDSLDRDESRVVKSAIDGGYETDDPPSWLGDFLDRVDFVRYEDVPYRLSDTLPRIVLTVEPVTGDTGQLSVASAERFHDVAPHHGGNILARARSDGFVDRDPSERFRNFLETYDGVRIGAGVLQFSVADRDSGPPYGVTAERTSLDAIRDAQSIDLSELPETARPRIRETLDETGSDVFGLADPSPAVVTKLGAVTYLRADGESYYVDAWPLDHLPLSVSATVTEAGIGFKDPGQISITLANTGSQPLKLRGGSPRPFGSLRYRPTDGGRERYLYPVSEQSSSMWPGTYSSHHNRVDELKGGTTRSVEYAIGGDAVGVPPGRHVVDGTIDPETGFRGGSFPFRIALQIE